jgi:hypothetical protein
MLIYSYKLEKYIINRFFRKILLLPNSYVIKGSFRRKVPYITDIDIVNKVYPIINKSTIYQRLIELINIIHQDDDIILVQITCGTDGRFKVTDANPTEVSQIKNLLTPSEVIEFDKILDKYKDNVDQKVFFINELIWPLYKLRWSSYQVLNNSMELRGDRRVSFEEMLENNSTLLLQYYLKINTELVGIDVAVYYEPYQDKVSYEDAAKYYLRLSNYNKEYYYMLFPLKTYFRIHDDKTNYELNNLIEKQMGLYKQLMVRIDAYRILYITNNLDIETAKNIIINLIKDVPKLPDFKTNVLSKMQDVAENNPPEVKKEQWYLLVNVLYDQINLEASRVSKDHFFHYLNLVPKENQKNYYIEVAKYLKSNPNDLSWYLDKFY